ncbi:Amino acid permease/ SLC12A domain [Sesbania bispinosa]|nr:Amino acid permease/ SLC12A domain [Sesbania bispinosa]
MAGIGETLLLVALCGTCTFLTSISLSAIATNGAMKGGGPYYLIGRALGPEVGVSIGLCFFLGNAVAGALYVLGAVETFLKAVPSAGIFRDRIHWRWVLEKVNMQSNVPVFLLCDKDKWA